MEAIRNNQTARIAGTGTVVYFEEGNYRNFDAQTSRVTCYELGTGACRIVSMWDLEALYGASPLATVLGWVADAGLAPTSVNLG
jgi:hypothetical protein